MDPVGGGDAFQALSSFLPPVVLWLWFSPLHHSSHKATFNTSVQSRIIFPGHSASKVSSLIPLNRNKCWADSVGGILIWLQDEFLCYTHNNNGRYVVPSVTIGTHFSEENMPFSTCHLEDNKYMSCLDPMISWTKKSTILTQMLIRICFSISYYSQTR